MIWTWEMQLAAGGRARLAAEQPHHGPMFEYTGVPYEGISLSMISHLAKTNMVKSSRKRAKKKDKWGKHVAQPPLIKWYRNVSVWISTINYRTVTQCNSAQVTSTIVTLEMPLQMQTESVITIKLRSRAVTLFGAGVTESGNPVQVHCCGHLHSCCLLLDSVTGSSWTLEL